MRPDRNQVDILSAASRTCVINAMNSVLNSGLQAPIPPRTPEACLRYHILHLLSAYKYLSASLRAMLTNDIAGAEHFAYYAQLRAAHSIYSGSGIVLSQKKDSLGNPLAFFVDATATAHTLTNVNSHNSIRDLWDEWSVSVTATDILNSIEVLPNLNFGLINNWIAGASFVSDFVKDLCFDIVCFENDHDARKVASYEPNINSEFFAPLAADKIDLHNKFINSIKDAGGSSKNIDVQIAVSSLSRLSTHSGISVASIVNSINANTGYDSAILTALLDSANQTPIADYASNNLSNSSGIISRALILLRMAEILLRLNTPATEKNRLQSILFDWINSHISEPCLAPTKRKFIERYDECTDDFYGVVSSADVWSHRNAYNSISTTQIEVALAWH